MRPIAVRVALVLTVAWSTLAVADLEIDLLARCQRRFAREGAKFAQRVIRAELDCSPCRSARCDNGVFGPSCDDNPPPCCDSDDRNSNSGFAACMDDADAECAKQDGKITIYEAQKVNNITNACVSLAQEELCGAQTDGLGFATLNAGCQALDPNYTCTLSNLINCVGGPLERQHLDEISMILHPRASDAIAVGNLLSFFPDLPVTRRVKEDVPAGKADVWSIAGGQAGDQVIVRVKTVDDNGNATSNLHADIVLLDSDQATAVADTPVHTSSCSVSTVCGAKCPQFKRSPPFTRTFYIAVKAANDAPCSGGKYRLVVTSPNGAVPQLVADDVDASGLP